MSLLRKPDAEELRVGVATAAAVGMIGLLGIYGHWSSVGATEESRGHVIDARIRHHRSERVVARLRAENATLLRLLDRALAGERERSRPRAAPPPPPPASKRNPGRP